MKTTTYKKTDFKVGGQVAYERYMFGELVGYSYKERKYQLFTIRLANGAIKHKEKFVGWGYGHFHKNTDETWDSWATYHRNFVNEIV